MLEHFHVPDEDRVMIRRADLLKTTTDIFESMGMSREDAELAADGLVTADIRGCETHGVSNMLRVYLQPQPPRRDDGLPRNAGDAARHDRLCDHGRRSGDGSYVWSRATCRRCAARMGGSGRQDATVCVGYFFIVSRSQ